MRSIGPVEIIVLAIAGVVLVSVVRNMKSGGIVAFAALGAVLGAALGFLSRPSFPLIGQLPIDVVLTRGAGLSGMDALLRPTAEQSFNYVIVGAILGAVVLAGAKSMSSPSPVPSLDTPSSSAPPRPAASPPAAASRPKAFCPECGTELDPDAIFCGSCGARRE